MSSPSSPKELHLNTVTLPANGLTSQSTQQPRPVCSWSAHATQSGPPPLPFPRYGHMLTATATAAGELFLFGGWVHGCASSDLYVISTRDFSTTLLQTSGEVPTPRAIYGAALIGTTLLICGGTNFGDQNVLNHDSPYLLNLVSREWTRVVVNGPGLNGRHYPTTTVVGSKLFVFGGEIGGKTINDMWTLDLDCLKSQPVWESYEPTPGNEKPPPRARHVSVTTKGRIIIFGGYDDQHLYNDTWSFDIPMRKWTELQCTGSMPSPRGGHAAVLVDDVIYVFGGYSLGKGSLDDLHALQLSTQRWIKFHNVGPSPHGRTAHTMASDGTRVFMLGGFSRGARVDELSLIHIFDTKDIKYPEPERDFVNPNEKTTQLAWKSSTGLPTQKQPQHPTFSSSEAHGASRLQAATPDISGRPASLQITHERNLSPNGRPFELADANSKPRRVPEDDASEGSTEYRAKSAAPSSSAGEVVRLELERQRSESLAAQAEQDQRIAQLTDKLTLKSSLLEQAEANAAEAANQLLIQRSLVERRDMELVDMQAKLDELAVSRDQQVGQHEKELANMRAKLEANESELEAVRLRFTDTENDLTKSKAEAETLRSQTATGFVNRDDEGQVTRWLVERVRAIEAEMASKCWDEKRIEEMECRNEG